MSNELQVGQVLDNRFRITALLSEGGMASVYEAHDRWTDSTVALKVPFSRYEADPVFFSRFRREEEIGQSLKHPAVVRFVPTDEKSRPYIIMERLRGKVLSEIVREGHPLPTAEALRIAAEIARTLEYLHSRAIVHRDLKPGNVMLCDDGSLRVMDLGLAKHEGSRDIVVPGFAHPLGTPDYMPPEQVKGEAGDPRSDIYALGAVLYEMVTGSAPFRGENLFEVMHRRIVSDPVAPSRLNPELSPQVEEIILHAMEREPSARYSTATEFREELEHPDRVIATGRADRLLPPKLWKIRWMRVRGFVWALLVILSIFAALVLVAWVFGKRR